MIREALPHCPCRAVQSSHSGCTTAAKNPSATVLALVLTLFRRGLRPLARQVIGWFLFFLHGLLLLGLPHIKNHSALVDVFTRNCEHISTPSSTRLAIPRYLNGVPDVERLEPGRELLCRRFSAHKNGNHLWHVIRIHNE